MFSLFYKKKTNSISSIVVIVFVLQQLVRHCSKVSFLMNANSQYLLHSWTNLSKLVSCLLAVVFTQLLSWFLHCNIFVLVCSGSHLFTIWCLVHDKQSKQELQKSRNMKRNVLWMSVISFELKKHITVLVCCGFISPPVCFGSCWGLSSWVSACGWGSAGAPEASSSFRAPVRLSWVSTHVIPHRTCEDICMFLVRTQSWISLSLSFNFFLFLPAVIVLIALGSVMLIVVAFGDHGACNEKRCSLQVVRRFCLSTH